MCPGVRLTLTTFRPARLLMKVLFPIPFRKNGRKKKGKEETKNTEKDERQEKKHSHSNKKTKAGME